MENLGKKAKDKVTGFEGIIIGKANYMFGCSQYGIVAKVKKDGTPGECSWFDEGRIEITGKGVELKSVRVERNGGPNRDCPK